MPTDIHIHFHFHQGFPLNVKPMQRFSASKQLFGLSYPQQQLAKLGRCPLCKAKGLVEAMRVDCNLSIMQCWACGELIIVPDDLHDPFMMHPERKAASNEAAPPALPPPPPDPGLT